MRIQRKLVGKSIRCSSQSILQPARFGRLARIVFVQQTARGCRRCVLRTLLVELSSTDLAPLRSQAHVQSILLARLPRHVGMRQGQSFLRRVDRLTAGRGGREDGGMVTADEAALQLRRLVIVTVAVVVVTVRLVQGR